MYGGHAYVIPVTSRRRALSFNRKENTYRNWAASVRIVRYEQSYLIRLSRTTIKFIFYHHHPYLHPKAYHYLSNTQEFTKGASLILHTNARSSWLLMIILNFHRPMTTPQRGKRSVYCKPLVVFPGILQHQHTAF